MQIGAKPRAVSSFLTPKAQTVRGFGTKSSKTSSRLLGFGHFRAPSRVLELAEYGVPVIGRKKTRFARECRRFCGKPVKTGVFTRVYCLP